MTPIKKRESKWKKEKNGEAVTSMCPVCDEEEESWEHYDYECKGAKQMNERIAGRLGRDRFSREKWDLEKEEMETNGIVSIATARCIYHCERCEMDTKRKKRLNIQTLMNRWNRRMSIANQQQPR